MITVGAHEARTQLPRLLRAVERGETVIISQRGTPVARLAPVQGHSTVVAEVIERMKRARAKRAKVTVDEIIAWVHEGHKY
jgi:prevent-host-death family protein